MSLWTLSSLAVIACPCVCGYAWVVRSSICICYMPRSVPPFVSTSAVFIPVPGLLAPLLLCLWLCLGCPLLCLCLLYAWICSSVCVCVCYVCAYAWFVDFSITVSVGILGLSALLSVFAVCLGLFLRPRLRLLCLCVCLVCRLFRRCVCSSWVVPSSVCVCYVLGSVPPSASTSAVSMPGPSLSIPLLLCLWRYLEFELLLLPL